MTEVVHLCPSGLNITVRGLKGSEMDLFANKQEIATRMISDKILSACTISAESMGDVYEGMSVTDDKFWDKALVCDRFSALLAVRIATHGAQYIFKVRCPSDTCSKDFEWEVNLSTLQRFALPKSSIPYAKDNEPIREILESGDTIFFRLLRGSDERAIHALVDKNFRAKITTGISRRLARVIHDGTAYEDNYDISKWVRELSVVQSMDLIATMDSHDGGYETELDIYCPHCATDMKVNIPFDEEFWIKRRPTSTMLRRERQQSQDS